MATFRELTKTTPGKARHQAMVRRGGHYLSRTFPTLRAAEKWAEQVEGAIALNSPVTPFNREHWLQNTAAKRTLTKQMLGNALDEPNAGWTMERALNRYLDTVSPKKASYPQEASRTKHLIASMGTVRMARLSHKDVQAHVDRRLAAGKRGATIRLEVMHIRAVWKHARTEQPHGWGVALAGAHPCDGLILPPLAAARDRRLHDADEAAGKEAEEDAVRRALAEGADSEEMVDLFDLCILTGMRRGELLGLTRQEIRKAGNIWSIDKLHHKGAHLGHHRRVVLSSAAAAIVARRMHGLPGPARLFSIRGSAAYTRFRKACKAAGVTGLRTHDLRHEGLSRMADAGLNLGELQAQSGHRSAQMLMRYLNGKAADVMAKLG